MNNNKLRSLVTAKNLGLIPKNRVSVHPRIESFLLDAINLNGLAVSDLFNIAIEQYLIQNNFITSDNVRLLPSLSTPEKELFD